MADHIRTITDEESKALQDAVHVVLDICHATIARHAAQMTSEYSKPLLPASALALAIQTIFLADNIGNGPEPQTITAERGRALYFGLGMGVGHSIAASVGIGQLLAMAHYTEGFNTAMASRKDIDKGKDHG